jgi:hypothetical protein
MISRGVCDKYILQSAGSYKPHNTDALWRNRDEERERERERREEKRRERQKQLNLSVAESAKALE